MIVYWGILETGREDHGTKTISWVPVIGRIIPDEKQKMRIRLKAAVIDVASGAWEFVIPEVYNDARTSARARAIWSIMRCTSSATRLRQRAIPSSCSGTACVAAPRVAR